MSTIPELADQMSERAARAERPGGPFTVKQAISRQLHQRAAELHARAKLLPESDERHHEAKHREHFDAVTQFSTLSRA